MAWNLGAIVVRFVADMTGWTKGKRQLSTDLRTLGREITILGTALTGFSVANVRTFAKFDKAIRTALAVSDVTEKQFHKMSEMALDMGVAINKAFTETASGFYFLGSAGLEATEQMQSFVEVNELARAVTVSVGEAAESVVDIMKGFHIEFANTSAVTDILTKSVITSNQTFTHLGESLSYVAGLANATNNTLEDTVTIMGLMADAGIKGSRAGTTFRRAIQGLSAPAGKLRNALRQLNIDTYDSEGRMKDLITIIIELQGALSGATEEYRNYILGTMFGLRALPGILQIFSKTTEEILKYRAAFDDAIGTRAAVLEKQMQSFWHQMGRLWRMVQRISIEVGKSLAPTLRGLADALGPVIDDTRNWVQENANLVKQITLITAVVGAFALVVGPLMYTLPNIVISISLLSAGFTSILAPIALIAIALYSIRAAWNASFGEISLKLPDFLKSLREGFSESIQRIMWEFSLLPKALETYLTRWKEILRLTWEQIKLYSKGQFIEAYAMNEMIQKLHDPKNMFALIFGTDAERKESFNQFQRDLGVVLGTIDDWTMDSFKLIGGNMRDQFNEDIDAVIAILKDKYPQFINLINLIRNALGGTEPMPTPRGDIASGGEGKKGKDVGQWTASWNAAIEDLIKNFQSLDKTLVDVMGNLQSSWEDTIEVFIREGGSFRDFMDNMFNAVLGSFTRMVARMITQRLFWELFSGDPTTEKYFGVPAYSPGGMGTGVVTPDAITGAAPLSMKPILTINNNTGIPIEATDVSTGGRPEDMIIDLSFKAAQKSARFRNAFYNERR